MDTISGQYRTSEVSDPGRHVNTQKNAFGRSARGTIPKYHLVRGTSGVLSGLSRCALERATALLLDPSNLLSIDNANETILQQKT